jgi:hypothetical protein
MNIRFVVSSAALALAAAGCGATAQHTQSTRVAGLECGGLANNETQVAELVSPDRVHGVEPIHFQRVYWSGPQNDHVIGAKLYVPAEANMSEAYLERVLSCHAAGATAAHPNDPLRVEGVRSVAVRAHGQRYEIAITGVDKRAGEEILQRAESLQGQVGVKQLASAKNRAAL